MSNRSSGRRRGRGGRSNSNRGPADGNRQGHRNQGNAHQLLDKYKNMARDAHQQGDRVMNEYYLQFADHYFRIVAEVNERKEEKQREREEARQAKQDKPNKQNEKADAAGADDEAPKKKPRRKAAPKDEQMNGSSDHGGDATKIDEDRLPAAIAVDAGADEVNGKAPRKPARPRRKPADGDGATTEG